MCSEGEGGRDFIEYVQNCSVFLSGLLSLLVPHGCSTEKETTLLDKITQIQFVKWKIRGIMLYNKLWSISTNLQHGRDRGPPSWLCLLVVKCSGLDANVLHIKGYCSKDAVTKVIKEQKWLHRILKFAGKSCFNECHTVAVRHGVCTEVLSSCMYWKIAYEVMWSATSQCNRLVSNCLSTSEGILKLASGHFLHFKRAAESPVKEEKEKSEREREENWKGEGQKSGGDCAHVHCQLSHAHMD